MPRIQILPPHLADLIAAGEVVERPASVVKELCENSIDAGAKTLTVEIKNGGMTYIRVTDDGCGMSPEDAANCFLRHATSKLRDERGLEAICTLGFRGEALAAIASVSRIELTTRERGAGSATRVIIDGGDIVDISEAGAPVGTTIIVRDLFFNTPARKKFMKTDKAEAAACSSCALRCALSNTDTAVRYIKDGGEEFSTQGDGKLSSAIYTLLGKDFFSGLIEIAEDETADIRVRGYVSSPASARGNRTGQFFFVNGRAIRSRVLQAALEQAYKNSLFTGRFPACVLCVDLGHGSVDVNVHPTKTDVKFLSEKQVFDAVYYSVLAALEREKSGAAKLSESAKPAPRASAEPRSDAYKTMTAEEYRAGAAGFKTKVPPAGRQTSLFSVADTPTTTYRTAAPVASPARPASSGVSANPERTTEFFSSFSRAGKEAPAPVSPEKDEAAPIETPAAPAAEVIPPAEDIREESEDKTLPVAVLGELFSCYIVAQRGDTALLIDKHAAHERMIFDRLRETKPEVMGQILLTPCIISLSPQDHVAITENAETLASLGFEADDFGGGKIAVRMVPADMDFGEIPSVMGELASLIASGAPVDTDELRNNVLKSVACKAAIKQGRSSEPAELEVIARAVFDGSVKYCPHGRPVAIEITKARLEKDFKRS